MKKLCVLGDGAWGTAIATLLAASKHQVVIWSRDAAVAHNITHDHVNERYLPGILLDPSITATTDLAQALHGAEWIFCAVPVVYLRAIIESVRTECTPDQAWVLLSKGIEKSTLKFPSQIVADVLGYAPRIVVLSGPSFAQDLARRHITGVTVASMSQDDALTIQQLTQQPYFKSYVSDDPLGVQAAAAFKNVVALGVGMLQGAGMTDNTQAFFVTRGLQEIAQLVQAVGGQAETVYGLAGVGDLMLTAMGGLSKNKELGVRIGCGETLAAIFQSRGGVVPEGVNTVQAVYELQQKYGIELPVLAGVYAVLFNGMTVQEMAAGT